MAKTTDKSTLSGVDGFAICLSSRLRDAMALRQITARALSDKADIPYRSLQNYIRGENAMPCHALMKVSDALGISADWFLSGHAAKFDDEVLVDSLNIFEDIRGLSDYKITAEEAAQLFVKYYEKFFTDKLPSSMKALDKHDADDVVATGRGGTT